MFFFLRCHFRAQSFSMNCALFSNTLLHLSQVEKGD